MVGLTAVVLVLAVVSLRIVQAPGGRAPAPSAAAAATHPGGVLQDDLVVAVQPGETMWTIAARLAPGRDPRPVVDALAVANGRTQLRAGQRLVIPAPLLAPALP